MTSSLHHLNPPLTIPAGLHQLLHDVTVAVLRAQPPDLYDFVIDYFDAKRAARLAGKADWKTAKWPASPSTMMLAARSSKIVVVPTSTHPSSPSASFIMPKKIDSCQILLPRRVSYHNMEKIQRPSIMRRKSILSSIRSLQNSKHDTDSLREAGAIVVHHPKSDEEQEMLRKLLPEIPIFW